MSELLNKIYTESTTQPGNPRRQKLIKALPAVPVARLFTAEAAGREQFPQPLIRTLEDLKRNLQTAVALEHSTIPPYLCALYSIKEGTNTVASTIIRSVVVEEMLHMILAANILNAIGGKPVINQKEFVPTYPGYLPGSDKSFIVGLEKFSKESIDVFLKIEKPSPPLPKMDPEQAADLLFEDPGFQTIGQFYQAIMLGIEYVNANTPGGIFINDPEIHKRQVTQEHYYGSGGMIVPVYSIENAREAIEEIVGQGEGIDDTIDDSDAKLFGQTTEYAHYFRFNELLMERMYAEDDTPKSGPTGEPIVVDWIAVHNMKANPKVADYKDQPDLLAKAKAFNQAYTELLDQIHKACNGEPEQLMKGIALMYKLKYLGTELMNIPLADSGMMAGPTFEYEP